RNVTGVQTCALPILDASFVRDAKLAPLPHISAESCRIFVVPYPCTGRFRLPPPCPAAAGTATARPHAPQDCDAACRTDGPTFARSEGRRVGIDSTNQ